MASYTIVAIPDRQDRIWDFSSEKVPHLTMLFLGDKLENVGRVADFIKHVAETSLRRFWLTVDRRDILGDKGADVLFFHEDAANRLQEIRANLLTNPDISKAYHSTEQFPTWIPHLTMGYPDSPAKKIPAGAGHRINLVDFDRLALWTGDYEGVEFPLKESESALHASTQRGEAFLSHFGIKGMRWGVRRSDAQIAKAAGIANDLVKTGVRNRADFKAYTKKSEDFVRADAMRRKIRVVGAQTLSNKELQDVIQRMNLEVQYTNLKRAQFQETHLGKGKKWVGNFVTDVLKDGASSWIKRPGSNATGRTSRRSGEVIDGTVVRSMLGR